MRDGVKSVPGAGDDSRQDEASPVETRFLDSKGRPRPAPMLVSPVADTHAHLSLLDDPASALARCAWQGVRFVCCVVDPSENIPEDDAPYERLESWIEGACDILANWMATTPGYRIAGQIPVLPGVRMAVGVHPHNAKRFTADCERELIRRAADPCTACIGEIGLDYHYGFSPKDVQRACFERQLDLAESFGLPVSLHLREAHDDALDILHHRGVPSAGCLIHCFNRDRGLLAPFLELGCHVAFGGPLTFKKSDDVREAATTVPLDRLLTETDCPYMTPEPCRGTPCEPAHTVFTAQRLQEVYADAHPEAGAAGRLLDVVYDNALALLDRAPVAWQSDAGAQQGMSRQATGSLSSEESEELCRCFPDDDEEEVPCSRKPMR